MTTNHKVCSFVVHGERWRCSANVSRITNREALVDCAGRHQINAFKPFVCGFLSAAKVPIRKAFAALAKGTFHRSSLHCWPKCRLSTGCCLDSGQKMPAKVIHREGGEEKSKRLCRRRIWMIPKASEKSSSVTRLSQTLFPHLFPLFSLYSFVRFCHIPWIKMHFPTSCPTSCLLFLFAPILSPQAILRLLPGTPPAKLGAYTYL